jgi:hypothetical protein
MTVADHELGVAMAERLRPLTGYGAMIAAAAL